MTRSAKLKLRQKILCLKQNFGSEDKQSPVPAPLQDQEASKAAETVEVPHIDAEDIDSALERAGCWSLRLLVSLACIAACIGNSISIVCASLAMPAAECDLQLSSVQLGVVNGAGFVGMLAGSLLIGAVSDTAALGRRGSVAATLSISAVATLVSALAPNFLVMMLLRCLVGVGTGGAFPVTLAYFSEWQPRRTRGTAVSALSSGWMLGGMIASAGAWVLLPRPLEWRLFLLGSISFGAWRLYLALCALPFIMAALAFGLCLPDSPSCLMQNEKTEQARFLLHKTANKDCHHNGISIDEQLEVNQPEALVPPQTTSSALPFGGCISTLLSDLLDRRHRRSIILLAVIHGALAFSYYGLLLWFPTLFKRAHQFSGDDTGESGVASLCTSPETGNNSLLEDIGGNRTAVRLACEPAILTTTKPYMEAFIVNTFNLPGNLVSLLLINRFGRRRLLSSSLALMAATTALIAGVWSHTQALAFSYAFAAVSAIAWNSYNVISVELLPTRLQTSVIGFCFATSRIFSLLGSVVFGALVDAGCLAPMSLSGGVLAIGALLTCALPATRTSLTSAGGQNDRPVTLSVNSPAPLTAAQEEPSDVPNLLPQSDPV